MKNQRAFYLNFCVGEIDDIFQGLFIKFRHAIIAAVCVGLRKCNRQLNFCEIVVFNFLVFQLQFRSNPFGSQGSAKQMNAINFFIILENTEEVGVRCTMGHPRNWRQW